jgi:orotate phosphoribosyltransferase
MQNLIEGRLPDHAKVMVIEDLISTGGSSLKAAEALRSAGAEVLGMAAVFTYGFETAKTAFDQSSINLVALTDYNTLIKVALDKKLVQDQDIQLLQDWRISPNTWGKQLV